MEESQPSRFVVPTGTFSPASMPPNAPLAVHDALRQFIAKVGGLTKATAALELLAVLENAPRDAGRKAA